MSARKYCWGKVFDYSDGRGGVVRDPKQIVLIHSPSGHFFDAVSGNRIRVPVVVVRDATKEEVAAARAKFAPFGRQS